jgi:hypothetical protein
MRLEDWTLPSTYTVLKLNDNGTGSLRAGIASSDDTIVFAHGLHGTIKYSLIAFNQANGNGAGAGEGGGAYNDAGSSLTLTASLVTQNQANGSPGLGGGVYNLGLFSADPLTIIADNHASTGDNDIGP